MRAEGEFAGAGTASVSEMRGGDDLFGRAGRVLGLEIVEAAGGDDLDEGEDLRVVIAEHRPGDLDARDEGFGQYLRAVLKGEIQRGGKLGLARGRWKCRWWNPRRSA